MSSYILSVDEINLILKELKKKIDSFSNNCIVILRGDLASGKTTLVKKYVKSLNIDDLVTSPTFSIQSIYTGDIYHYDVYNKTLEEFISLGLLEEFDKNGTHFIEWADKRLEELLKSYGFDVILVEIEKKDDKRQYTINE